MSGHADRSEQSLAASPHHGLVVSTSSDGTAMLSSGIRALRRRRVRGHFTQKLFRFDFKRETGELRMWDNLDVEVGRFSGTSSRRRMLIVMLRARENLFTAPPSP